MDLRYGDLEFLDYRAVMEFLGFVVWLMLSIFSLLSQNRNINTSAVYT